MLAKQTDQPTEITPNQSKQALNVALNILTKWSCSEQEKMAILGIGRSTLHKYQNNPQSARISPDLLERISYLLNTHQSLRLVFNNPENVYGFIRMPNHNSFFNGKTPMEIMAGGRVAHLYEVNKQIDTLRGGQW